MFFPRSVLRALSAWHSLYCTVFSSLSWNLVSPLTPHPGYTHHFPFLLLLLSPFQPESFVPAAMDQGPSDIVTDSTFSMEWPSEPTRLPK